ncbi:hypothetical protein [Candidatus Poriferisodalis sp.]|uniref:hypothetical protein n=1 Tax=Candidatus Poriferisodalis sp. TaxID=3101277 RepID=UPI003B026ED6
MFRRALQKIVSGLKHFSHFLEALSLADKKPSAPDPRKAAARRVREAMHSSRGGTTLRSNTEDLYAKELSEGYKQQR